MKHKIEKAAGKIKIMLTARDFASLYGTIMAYDETQIELDRLRIKDRENSKKLAESHGRFQHFHTENMVLRTENVELKRQIADLKRRLNQRKCR